MEFDTAEMIERAGPLEAQREVHSAWSGWSRIGHGVCVLVFLVALAVETHYHYRWRAYPYDDAFITYRYAAQFLRGNGLVYNPGQHVFGSSSPLFVLYCVAVGFVARAFDAPLPETVVVLNGIWYGLIGWAVVRIINRRVGAPWGWVCGAALLMTRSLFQVSIGGMESSLFTALLLWGFLLVDEGRTRIGAIVLGLAVVCRPEGLFLIPIGGLALWRSGGVRTLRRSGALLLLPGLTWAAFALFYYGSLVPQSVLAKRAPIYPYTLSEAWWAWLKVLGRHFNTKLHTLADIAVCWPLIGLAACTGWRGRRGNRLAGWLLLFSAGCFGLYVGGTARPVPWYRIHLCVPVGLAVLLGLVAGSEWLGLRLATSRSPGGAGGARTALSAVMVVVFLHLAGFQAAPALRSVLEPVRNVSPHSRVLDYRRVGEQIDRELPPDATVLAPEIGALGYYCRQTILDACGLVSPEAMPYLPVPEPLRGGKDGGVIHPQMVADLRPDYVVTLPSLADKGLLRQPWFAVQYRCKWSIPLAAEVWANREVLVFERITGVVGSRHGRIAGTEAAKAKGLHRSENVDELPIAAASAGPLTE